MISYDFTGCRVVVTGGSSGIGKTTALDLHRSGAEVIVVGRNLDTLNEITAKHDRLHASVFDLADSTRIGKWLVDLTQQHGPIDRLVHCAGLHMLSPIHFMEADDLDQLINVNFRSTIEILKACRNRKLVDSMRSVVCVSSVAAYRGQAGATVYAATKAAAEGLVRSTAIEFAPVNIRVNSVSPGFVETPMSKRMTAKWTDSQVQSLQDAHPLGFGQTTDVSNAIMFLLDDSSKWITGTSLSVDGGFLA